jgi:hypothetical protein
VEELLHKFMPSSRPHSHILKGSSLLSPGGREREEVFLLKGISPGPAAVGESS